MKRTPVRSAYFCRLPNSLCISATFSEATSRPKVGRTKGDDTGWRSL